MLPLSGPIRRAAGCAALAAVLALTGCKGDGLSDYQRMENAKQNLADSLRSQGVKLEERDFPQGKAWAVNLSGLTITDELLDQLKQLQNITEMNLSKSTVNDTQLARMHELNLCVKLLKFDLSQTAVTDSGLDKLVNVILLTDLNLTGSKATSAGAERLKKRRQNDVRIPAMFRTTKVRL